MPRKKGDENDENQKRSKKSTKKESTLSKKSGGSHGSEKSHPSNSTASQDSRDNDSSSPKETKRSSERLKQKRKPNSPKKRRTRESSGDGSSTEAASDSPANVPPGGDGQSSPESCPICLCRLENKSFTDSCFHTFCFVCLQEWSKQKAECPLCKQKFKSIIHNVRSLEDYDQYYIQENNQQLQQQQDRRFRYRTTMVDHTYDPWLVRQQQERERQLALFQRPSRVTSRHQWQRLRQISTSSFRKRVYAQNMRVNTVRSSNGRQQRFRNTSPEFFTRNPATTHRLVPWLNRELNVILGGNEHREFILELIIDLIKRFEIRSAEFREHMHPFIGRHTDIFIHEFHSFARSPYDMTTYDNRAVYEEPLVTVGSDSDQEDVVTLTPPEPQRRQAATSSLGAPTYDFNIDLMGSTLEHMQRAALRMDPILNRVQELLSSVDGGGTANSGWESPIAGTSSSVMWSPPQATTPPQTSSSDPFTFLTSRSSGRVRTGNNGPIATVVNNLSSSGSENDIEIVGYEKPYEQRSPIAVDDSDSDAINVVSVCTSRKKSKKKKKKKSEDKKRDMSPRKSKHDRRDRSRSHSRDCHRDYDMKRSESQSPRRRKHEERRMDKERRRDYLREHKKSSHSQRENSLKHTERHRDRCEDYRFTHFESDRYESSRHTHEQSISHDCRSRTRSSSMSGSECKEQSQRRDSPHNSTNRKGKARSRSKSQTARSKLKSQQESHRTSTDLLLKRRKAERSDEIESVSGSFSKLVSTRKSPTPQQYSDEGYRPVHSPERRKEKEVRNGGGRSPSYSTATENEASITTAGSSPEKSSRRIIRSVASVVRRKSRSRSPESNSPERRSVASVIRVRSRSRSSDCQFFISRSTYRTRDSDDSSIEFIVAKPGKHHKKHKKSKKHKKRRYYVIEDTDSDASSDVEILDALSRHKRKVKERQEGKTCKKHHTGHKKSSKKRTDEGESSQDQSSTARCSIRAASVDSVEVVAFDDRNVLPLIGAEVDISSPLEEPLNLTRQKTEDTLKQASPDELHRKCEVSSSGDVLERIIGSKLAHFDPLSIAGEIVAYPLHGQERDQGHKEDAVVGRDNEANRTLPPVMETIAQITDTVERELAKKDGQNGHVNEENGQQLSTSANSDDQNQTPSAMEWQSPQNHTTCATHMMNERKRQNTEPATSSPAIKSSRLSDTETEVAVASSSASDAGNLTDRHSVPQQSTAVEIPELTQTPTDMDSKTGSEVGALNSESDSCEKAQATEGFGLLPPSCDLRTRSPSKDPVLFPVPTSSYSQYESQGSSESQGNIKPSATESTAQTISSIVQAVEKELTSRRSSQSEDSNTDGPMVDPLEQKSREIACVGGDKPKTPPPLAVDNMFSLGCDDSDSDENQDRNSRSPVDPNLYELVGQIRRSPSRSASMILLASMNAQRVFNTPSSSDEGNPSDSAEKDLMPVPQTNEEKLAMEVALKSNRCSLADISDIVGDLSKTSSMSSLQVPDEGRQRIDRIMSLTKMDLFEPESSTTEEVTKSIMDTSAPDTNVLESPTVGPSALTDMIQKDIQTNNGTGSKDLASLEKQMREKIAARLEHKDNLPPSGQDDQS